MDIETAKTLVSALTVLAIAVFSVISIEMFFASITRDLKAAWVKRTGKAKTGDEDEGVTPSAAT